MMMTLHILEPVVLHHKGGKFYNNYSKLFIFLASFSLKYEKPLTTISNPQQRNTQVMSKPDLQEDDDISEDEFTDLEISGDEFTDPKRSVLTSHNM